MSLITLTILELEKSLLNKIFWSNIKPKMLFYKLFSGFFEFAMRYIFATWHLGIFSYAKNIRLLNLTIHHDKRTTENV